MTISKFTNNEIEAISKIIADTNEGVTGSELISLLKQIGINDSSTWTKWRKLHHHLSNLQAEQNSPINIVQFIQNTMEPSRYIDDLEKFNLFKSKLNKVLLLKGLELNNSGKIVYTKKADTLDEASKRANQLKHKLTLRTIHSNVLKFCEKEYLQKNYFHAVFESIKSILERLRELSSISDDGVQLVHKVFNDKKPVLCFNKYETISEKNELMGFKSLIIGLIKMIRNPHAHEARVKWAIDEKDALDVLTMVSYVHRKLDETFRTGY